MTKKNSIDRLERFKGLRGASFIAISVDLLLITLKYGLASISGNPVIFADVLHSTGDLAITFSVMVSIFINFKLPNNRFARHAEGIVALIISGFLIFGSLNLIWGVLNDSSPSYQLSNDLKLLLAIIGINFAMFVSFYMSRYKRDIGEKYDSFAFKAESSHTYSDFITSFGIWLTLLLGFFGIHFEKLTTVLVGLIVIKIGLSLFLQSLKFFNFNRVISFLENIINIIYGQLRILYSKIGILFMNHLKGIFIWVNKYTDEEWIVKNKKILFKYNILFIVFLYFGTGFYLVKPSQSALNFILGENIGTVTVGMHYNLPEPFGETKIIETDMVLRVESGFRVNKKFNGKEPNIYLWESSHLHSKITKVPNESICLTGDENIVDANFLCYYKISDPLKYSMKIENVKEILRNIFTYEIHSVLAYNKLDEILTSARGTVQNKIKDNMVEELKKIPLGIEIIDVYMLDAHPPIEVVPKYRAVASAREKKNEIIFNSETYVNDLIPKSRGKAEALKIYAKSYAYKKISKAQGETANYNLKQRIFNNNIAINKSRLWWDNIEKVLKNKNIYILPRNIRKRYYSSDSKGQKIKDLKGIEE